MNPITQFLCGVPELALKGAGAGVGCPLPSSGDLALQAAGAGVGGCAEPFSAVHGGWGVQQCTTMAGSLAKLVAGAGFRGGGVAQNHFIVTISKIEWKYWMYGHSQALLGVEIGF